MLTTATSDRKQTRNRTHKSARLYNGVNWRFALGLLCCFLISLFVCLKQNLSKQSLDLAAIFDSGHYLYSTQQFIQLIQKLSASTSPDSIVHACRIMAEPILLDGPVLPLITASFCLLLGKVPTVFDMAVPIVLQAIIQGLCATMVSVLAARVVGGKWALVAGVLWGLYPPAVFAASKILTEPIAALFLVTLVVTLTTLFLATVVNAQDTKNKTIAILALICGVIIECLILLKPALLFGIVAMPLATFLLIRRVNYSVGKLKRVGLWLILGVMLMFAPWIVFTKVATQQFLPIPRRMPVLNLLAGLNYEADGWECVPKAPLAELFTEKENPLVVAWGIVQADPKRSLDLLLCKPVRLWSKPYNDYGTRFFGLPLQLEQFFHAFIVMLGSIGVLLCFIKSRTDTTSELNLSARRLICILSTIIIGAHGVFLFFEGTYRYAFTSMPFLLVFAVYCFKETLGKRSSIVWVSLVLVLFLSSFSLDSVPIVLSFVQSITLANSFDLYLRLLLLFMSFAAACIYFTQHDQRNRSRLANSVLALCFPLATVMLLAWQNRVSEMHEWNAIVGPDAQVRRSIMLNASVFARRSPDWALVLVDGDKSVSRGTFSVNGVVLENKAEPLYLFDSQRTAFGNFEIFAAAMRLKPQDLRQWRAVEVPIRLLKPGESNEICLRSGKMNLVTIYGAYPRNTVGQPLAPSLWDFAPKYLMDGGRSLEPRIRSTWPSKTERAICQLQVAGHSDDRDLSLLPGRQIGQYRMYLVLGYKSIESNNAKQSSIRVEDSADFTEQVRSAVVRPQAPYSWIVHLPKRQQGSHHVRVSLSFDTNSSSVPSQVTYWMIMANKAKTGYDLDLTEGEAVTELSRVTQRCLFTKVVPISVDRSSHAIKILFRAPKSEIKMENLTLKLKPANSPDFAGHRIAIF